MKELSEISNIAEAKAYIEAEARSLHDRSDQYFFKPLASLILSLADLYREERTPEEYQSRKVALSGAIEALTAQAGLEALPFAPSIFLLLKFGFAVSEDPESSDIVRYKLINSLINVFGNHNIYISINSINSYDDYLSFLSDAVRSRRQGSTEHYFGYKLSEFFHKLKSLLEDWCTNWPENVEQRATALAAAHLAYRQAYAAQLEPIINARVRHAIETDTSYDEKRELIKSFNEELRLGGLAVRCEVRDDGGNVAIYPGIFVIGTARHGAGRFRVEYQDADGKKTYGLSKESEPIRLMPAPSRHDLSLPGPAGGLFADRLAAERSTQASKHL